MRKSLFVDNEREGAIGKLEDVESFYPEYNCAIAACDDGVERLEWNKKLEALYNIPVLFHMDSTISPSANLMPGCIVEPRAVVGCGSTIGQATVIGANVVVEPYCFIGDSCTLKIRNNCEINKYGCNEHKHRAGKCSVYIINKGMIRIKNYRKDEPPQFSWGGKR